MGNIKKHFERIIKNELFFPSLIIISIAAIDIFHLLVNQVFIEMTGLQFWRQPLGKLGGSGKRSWCIQTQAQDLYLAIL